jgi:hypothetical protein
MMMADKTRTASSRKPAVPKGATMVETPLVTIYRDDQGSLLLVVDNESGDEVPLPPELAYLVN